MKKKQKIGLINLGCSRNLVDAEEILGRLRAKGFAVGESLEADVVIVNTCAFIDAAKQESVNAILDLIELKKRGKLKKIIVAGCLAQRYGQQLLDELKDVDAISGVLPLDARGEKARYPLTPAHSVYVKICESCYNHCSFCVIPQIKGKFISRSPQAVLDEIKHLDQAGVREINVIGQDITAYGMDIGHQLGLAALLADIARQVKNVQWIRLLYAYPSHVTDDLLDIIAQDPRVCKYLDLPLQHINDRILTAMDRRMTGAQIRALIDKIRDRIPGIRLRTTFIVGFPGETEKEFEELRKFIRATKFDKLGVFTYSQEEGTRAALLPDQIPSEIKQMRHDFLMQDQQAISRGLLERVVGQTFKVLIDGCQEGEENVYLGRSAFDAPDVDGLVVVHASRSLSPGEFVEVRVTDALEYDLEGECV